MSVFYAYIATKQTVEPYVPAQALNLATLARDTSDGFYALQGGYLRVGQISLFPVQRAVVSHLLCDGSEVAKTAYPELFDYLGTSQGTPVNPANFVLPNFVATFTPAATAAAETVTANTVTSEIPAAGGGNSGGSIRPARESGGRDKT